MEYGHSQSGSAINGSYGMVSEFSSPSQDNGQYVQPKHEEWSTSKKVTNHITRQVETRVKRQIVVEDGKVIWDTGPQIITKTTEDTTMEDNESTERKTGDFVAEKTESKIRSRLTKEENAELEDDPRWQLSPDAYHHLSVIKSEIPRGRLTHYNSHSKQVTDRDVERSLSSECDGQINTETTHTHQHEELEDDEVPEDDFNRLVIPEASVENCRTYEVSTSDTNHIPDDLVETSKTRAGGNVINIEMATNRKQQTHNNKRGANSQLIYVKSPSYVPKTRDSETQTPSMCNFSRAKTYGNRTDYIGEDKHQTINRFVSALDHHFDDYPTPPSTPPRLIHPYRNNRYNGSSSASPPDSPADFRNYVADDYRQWIPPNSRKWTCSDGTVVVEVKHRDKRKY